MITFLWIISFILHGVSFLIIILLYTRFDQIKDIEKNQVMMIKDMEELLTAYITEIKDENETFLEKAKMESSHLGGHNKNIRTVEKRVDSTDIRNEINSIESQLTGHDIASLLPSYHELEILKEDRNTNEIIKVDPVHSEGDSPELLPVGRQARLLHNTGLSIEEIAKKLNKGKTEIELFLKFNE